MKMRVLATIVVTIAIIGTACPWLADAAIPDATGAIHASRHKNSGAVRIIDAEAGDQCLSSEEPLAWSGAPSSSAGPVAFASVEMDFDSDPQQVVAVVNPELSSGISADMITIVFVALQSPVISCFDVPFQFKNIMVTPQSRIAVSARAGTNDGCPESTDFVVSLANAGRFYVLLH